MRKLLAVTLLFSMNAQAIDLILGGISHHIGQKRYQHDEHAQVLSDGRRDGRPGGDVTAGMCHFSLSGVISSTGVSLILFFPHPAGRTIRAVSNRRSHVLADTPPAVCPDLNSD